MKPVWARAAIRDLVHAREYIGLENETAASEMASRIVDATDRIVQFPEVSRPGRLNGTRELVVSGTRYLIVYRLRKNAVHFLRVLHGRQKWPPA